LLTSAAIDNRGKELQARFLGRDPVTGKAMTALYDGESDQSINEVLVQEGVYNQN
jgi:hypothetical protein